MELRNRSVEAPPRLSGPNPLLLSCHLGRTAGADDTLLGWELEGLTGSGFKFGPHSLNH